MGRRHRHDRVRRERKKCEPTVSFPRGITPPIRGIIGEKIVNGKKEIEYSYYTLRNIPTSELNANGNAAELEILLAIAPRSHDDPNVIDYNTYVKEQLEIIAQQKEMIFTLKGMLDRNPDVTDEWLALFTKLKELTARRNVPSKDWKPFTGRSRLPQYAHLPEPQFLAFNINNGTFLP